MMTLVLTPPKVKLVGLSLRNAPDDVAFIGSLVAALVFALALG